MVKPPSLALQAGRAWGWREGGRTARAGGAAMRTVMRLGVLAAALAAAWAARADDWPQWRGPGRDNVSKETGLKKSWPADGPPLAWTADEAGAGFGGPAFVGDR